MLAPSPTRVVAPPQEWLLTGRISETELPVSVTIDPLPFRVGRRPGSSLTIPRHTISAAHAEFLTRDHRLIVRDLKSTNGTFVNGQRLEGEILLHDNDLVQFADAPFRVMLSEENHTTRTYSMDDAGAEALAVVQFDRLLKGKSVIPHFQPIVELHSGTTVAYEALARSRLPGLEMPKAMFSAAESLGKTAEFSRITRRRAVEDCALVPDMPHLFLNMHPCEMEVETLLASCRDLRQLSPHQRFTLEIHESAIPKRDDILKLRTGLDELNFSVAFDDFGAGQARIAELAEIRPEFLKFDRAMIHKLEQSDASRKRLVQSLVTMARDLGIVPLAEGMETIGERDACVEAGFVLAQGWLFGRPAPATHLVLSQMPQVPMSETRA